MSIETWLLFVATEAAICASPGPAVLYVSTQALSHGFGRSVAANLGIVAGNTVYFIASAFGLGALILASNELFVAIKWLGVAYLIWLGLRTLLSRDEPIADGTEPSQRAAIGASSLRLFRGGMVVQLANPKNLVFFVAILPPFIDPSVNVLLQIAILGVTSQVIEFVTLGSYGALAGGAGRWLRRTDAARWLNRIAGATLIAIGTGLAFVRRADG